MEESEDPGGPGGDRGAVLGSLFAALDEVLGVDLDTVTDVELHDGLVGLMKAQALVVAAVTEVAGRWDALGVWATDGSKSAKARLGRDVKCDPKSAGHVLWRARRLASMPLTRTAFGDRVMSVDHVDVLCRANTPARAELFARDEAVLVSYATSLDSFDGFHRAVMHWQNAADDECDRPDRRIRDREGRRFHASFTLGGVLDITGRLDAVDGLIVAGELERLEQALFQADWAEARSVHGENAKVDHIPRTAAQRRADALVIMARRSAAIEPGSKLTRPLFSVVVGAETFRGPICEAFNNTVLTPAQVASWLTDADVERVVFDPSGALRIKYESQAARSGETSSGRLCDLGWVVKNRSELGDQTPRSWVDKPVGAW